MKATKILASAIASILLWAPVNLAAAKPVLFTGAKQTTQKCAIWWETAKKAGWRTHHLPTLDYILWRESRCNGSALNKTLNQDKSWDYGLTQINDRSWCLPTRWYPIGYLQTKAVLDYCKDLLDPFTNLKAAKSLYDYSERTNGNGFQPWGL